MCIAGQPWFTVEWKRRFFFIFLLAAASSCVHLWCLCPATAHGTNTLKSNSTQFYNYILCSSILCIYFSVLSNSVRDRWTVWTCSVLHTHNFVHSRMKKLASRNCVTEHLFENELVWLLNTADNQFAFCFVHIHSRIDLSTNDRDLTLCTLAGNVFVCNTQRLCLSLCQPAPFDIMFGVLAITVRSRRNHLCAMIRRRGAVATVRTMTKHRRDKPPLPYTESRSVRIYLKLWPVAVPTECVVCVWSSSINRFVCAILQELILFVLAWLACKEVNRTHLLNRMVHCLVMNRCWCRCILIRAQRPHHIGTILSIAVCGGRKWQTATDHMAKMRNAIAAVKA